ncbi:MAG: sigma-70 family RNA polymerase sigma factor [Planctomycetota bacterium]
MMNLGSASGPQPGLPLSLEGDELALHLPWLRRFARALVHDEASADDLVQDALGAAITARRPIADLRSYLGGALRRRSHDVARREERRRRRESVHSSDRDRVAPGADDAAARVETMRMVLDEVERLPAAQRDAITLRYVDDLRPVEIAERLRVAPATVRAHIARGLATIRERLDRRSQGRAAWTAALVPWQLHREPVRALTASSLAVATVAAGALVAAFLAFVLVRSFEEDPAAGQQVALRSAVDGEHGATDMASIERSNEARRTAVETGEQDGEGDAPAPVSAAVTKIQGSVVDERTGAPIPDLPVLIRPLGPDDVASFEGVQALESSGGFDESIGPLLSLKAPPYYVGPGSDCERTIQVQTDAEGRFECGDTLEPGPVAIWTPEDRSATSYLPRVVRAQFPLTEPLRLRVGPTFRLACTLPSGVEWEDVEARFGDEDLSRAPLRGARPRRGDLPWVRFSSDVARMKERGPWRVRFTTRDLRWLAEVEVSRHRGVEPEPVALVFRSVGGVDFEAPVHGDGDATVGGSIRLTELATGRQHAVEVTASQRASVAEIRALAQGKYRWARGGRRGEIEVVGGEIARVDRESWLGGPTFDAELLLDAREVDEEVVQRFLFVLVDTRDSFHVLFQFPVPDESRGDGWWRIPLERIPARDWTVFLHGSGGAGAWEPRTARVGPSRPSGTWTLRSAGPLASLRVRVVDAKSGAPIQGADVAVGLRGVRADRSESTREDGTAVHGSVAVERESLVVVTAEGYRGQARVVRPEATGLDVTFELVRGWRSPIRVFRTDGFVPAAGVDVVVDGVEVGRTDTDGLYWVEGDGPPARIDVAVTSPSLEVDVSPFTDAGRHMRSAPGALQFLVRAVERSR